MEALPLTAPVVPAGPAPPAQGQGSEGTSTTSTTKIVVIIVVLLVLGAGVALLVWYFFDKKRGKEGADCLLDGDCAEGLVCRGLKCAPAPLPGACTSNSDCPAGQACLNGQCAPAGQTGAFGEPCTDGGGCDPGLTCTVRGRCLQAEGQPCSQGNDCASSLCSGGRCARPECDEAHPCPAGKTCVRGACVGDVGGFGQPCAPGQSCDLGYTCAGGKCLWSAGHPCEGTGAGFCASGVCSGGKCTSAEPSGCSPADDTCGPGRYCSSTGVCLTRVGAAESCTGGVKCMENLVCSAGFCQVPGHVNGELGAACGPGLPCVPPYVCRKAGTTSASTCQLPGEGEACSERCAPGLQCYQGVCTRPACFCTLDKLCGANNQCQSVSQGRVGLCSPYVRHLGVTPAPLYALLAYDDLTETFSRPLFSFSGAVAMPPVTAVINLLDPLDFYTGLITEDGVYSLSSAGLTKPIPASLGLGPAGTEALVPGGGDLLFESCSAGYALYRGATQNSALYLVRTTPQLVPESATLAGYTFALAVPEPFEQEGGEQLPVTVSSFLEGRVLLLAARSASLIYSVETQVPAGQPIHFAQQDIQNPEGTPQLDRPQLVGFHSFAVLAAYPAKQGVYLEYYAYSEGNGNAGWVRQRAVSLAGAQELAQVRSYWYVSGGGADARYAYIAEAGPSSPRRLYTSWAASPQDVGPNTAVGAAQVFTDYVCLE